MKIISKRNIYLLSVFVITLLFIVIDKTYAKFPSSYTTNDNIVGLVLDFNIGITDIEEYQEIEVEAGEIEKFNVKVTNNLGDDTFYGVWYRMVEPTTINSDIEIGRLKGSSTTTSGTIKNNNDLTVTIVIENNTTSSIKIDLGVAVPKKGLTEIEYINGKKLITGELDYAYTLNNILKSKAILDTSIDFSQISSDTNGKGVYIRKDTENDANPIYYYRGAVEDNNVIFADMCFKIVRTTETGGTKLIYNGLPTNGQCIATGADVLISEMSFNDKVDISVSAAQPLTDAGYMYGTQYYFGNSTKSENFLYGSDVKYENGEYSLIGTTQMQYNVNTKYTCASTGDTCEKVWYIFGSVSSGRTYYIELINGKKIKDAISDMLDYNINSSAIKGNKDAEGSVDNWYYKNIEQKGYSKYVEDTVWCQDRSIPSLGGWDQTSTVGSGHLYFDVYNRVQNRQPSLECIREVDKFTVSKENGNGDLDYPVGLLTADEVMLAGAVQSAVNDTFYLYNNEGWWLISSRGYHGIGYGSVNAFASGYYSVFTVQTTLVRGVRPAIALNSKVKIKEGNGTKEEPYIVMY